jgi:hypothetical protein
MSAQECCLQNLQCLFRKVGIDDVCLRDMKDPMHAVQDYAVAVRNGDGDRRGVVFRNPRAFVAGFYAVIGLVDAAPCDFQYKIFDLTAHSAEDVLDFVDVCEDRATVLHDINAWRAALV